jgi:hypothetical protein
MPPKKAPKKAAAPAPVPAPAAALCLYDLNRDENLAKLDTIKKLREWTDKELELDDTRMTKIEEVLKKDKAKISKLEASVKELLGIINDMKKTCLTSGYSKKMWKYESFLTMLNTRQLQQTVKAKDIGTTKTIKMVAERWGICVKYMLDGRAPEYVIFAAGVKGASCEDGDKPRKEESALPLGLCPKMNTTCSHSTRAICLDQQLYLSR